MAYKAWTAGELLTSADVNGYLMNQSVIVCTSGTRPGSPVDGMVIFETDTRRYMTYSSPATAWALLDNNEQLFARKTGTQSVTSSTTLVTDTALSVTVQANATYQVVVVLNYGGAAAGDIKVLVRCPTSASFTGFASALITTAASQQDTQVAPYTENASVGWGALGSGSQYGRIEGVAVIASTAGTMSIEWAQNTSSSTSTQVFAGSYLMLTRVT